MVIYIFVSKKTQSINANIEKYSFFLHINFSTPQIFIIAERIELHSCFFSKEKDCICVDFILLFLDIIANIQCLKHACSLFNVYHKNCSLAPLIQIFTYYCCWRVLEARWRMSLTLVTPWPPGIALLPQCSNITLNRNTSDTLCWYT